MKPEEVKKLISYIKRLVEAETKKAVANEVKRVLQEQQKRQQKTQIQQKRVEPIAKQKFTTNPILNQMLQETAAEGKWRNITADDSTPPAAYMGYTNTNIKPTMQEEFVDYDMGGMYQEETNSSQNIPDMNSFMNKKLNEINMQQQQQQYIDEFQNTTDIDMSNNLPDFLKKHL